MQALILAAGMGKRLTHYTQYNTKCMVKIGNKSLLERALENLESNGIKKVGIVVGYKKDELVQYVNTIKNNLEITIIENHNYMNNNNIISLYLAQDFLLQDDTLLLESDLIFENSVITKLIQSQYPNSALLAKYQKWMDGTVATIDNDMNIINFIDKAKYNYQNTDTYFKTVNIYKFTVEFVRTKYLPFLTAYIKAFGENQYYEAALRPIVDQSPSNIKAVVLNEEKWYEIDNPHDLDVAKELFSDSNI